MYRPIFFCFVLFTICQSYLLTIHTHLQCVFPIIKRIENIIIFYYGFIQFSPIRCWYWWCLFSHSFWRPNPDSLCVSECRWRPKKKQQENKKIIIIIVMWPKYHCSNNALRIMIFQNNLYGLTNLVIYFFLGGTKQTHNTLDDFYSKKNRLKWISFFFDYI